MAELQSKVKIIVIAGYILVVLVMLVGLWQVYRNLVDFSEKKIRNEDLRELILVGNVINRLFEVESSQNIYTPENASDYITKYNSAMPLISAQIDTLRQLTSDSARIVKLDSIEVLIDKKEENLRAIFVLMDSLSKAPQITRKTVSTYVPKGLNTDIERYLENKSLIKPEDNALSDTTVIRAARRGLFRRIGDAIRGREDSTVIIQNSQTAHSVAQDELRLTIDTVVNMVRYYERLNLENQRKFQLALVQRQALMNTTNSILTDGIDDLLKSIEQEEIQKSIRLLQDKDTALSKSNSTVLMVSVLAIVIAIVFGLLFLADINRSQQNRKRLEESNQRVKHLLRSREKLMLSISHDIKAPMSSILGYIELMESGADENAMKLYLSNMKKSGDHILQLVTNLLDYQKIESGTLSRKEMNFNVFELVQNTVGSFAPLAKKQQLQYRVENKVPDNLTVYGDPFMIREIYSNLISNALKYTHSGKVDVVSEIETVGNSAFLKFAVTDTGLGIDKKYQNFIFQEFTQIKPEDINSHAEGSGLGLAITKGLIEELGGEINLISEKGKGSQFTVKLPLDAARSVETQIQHEADFSTYKLHDKNISVLVVDDDPIQLTMISEMLKLKNIAVVTEINPLNALNILKNRTFDMIFLDIQMPEMNGFTLLRKILDGGLLKNKPTPIFSLSAKSDVSAHDFRKSGFTDFLNKPFTSTDLFNLMCKHLNPEIAPTLKSDGKPLGAQALIEVVKDDKQSSLEILRAFVQDTEKNTKELERCMETGDMENVSHYAHKMIPLFKMMDDTQLSDILLKLELKQLISDDEKTKTITAIYNHLKAAEKLISEIETS